MKKIFKLALMVALMCSATAAFAQKFGYINSQDLISVMPERVEVETKLEALSKELTEQLEAIQVEYNNKAQELQKNRSLWSASVIQLKERELQTLQQRFGEFQQTAQQDMQNMQTQLMAPVVTKAEAAITKISEANGLTAVFDVSSGALAYYNKATMQDVLPLVKKEMGIAQ
ncbi:MAG: OmpH family outer membrane protein [Rikenellaceae bacterium]